MSTFNKYWRKFFEAAGIIEPQCKHERTYTISDPIATCEQRTTTCCDCFEVVETKLDC